MTLDVVRAIPNGGWDERVVIVRCAPTLDGFIVVTRRHVVLIDTLVSPETAGAMLEIARPWLRDGRAPLVVVTHADWDHCYGNQLFAGPDARLPAPLIATRDCGARFASGEVAAKLAELQAREPGRFDAVRLVAPTLLFDERLAIDGGDLTLECFRVPGHRADQLAIFIPEIATLLPGDAAEAPFPFVESAATLPQMRASLRRLADLGARTVLYSHAPETSGPGLLAANIGYFDRLEARCRAALASGVRGDTAATAATPLDALVGFPLAEAVPPGTDLATLPEMYRAGHRDHAAMMLAWLEGGN